MVNLKKYFWDRKIKRLRKNVNEEGKKLAKIYKMVSFRNIDGSISEFQSNHYNSAYDTELKRFHISNVPITTVESLIKELKRLSNKVLVIQIEFDEFNNGKNVEIEIYNHSEITSDLLFDISNHPCSVTLSERFYDEFIENLRKKSF